MIMNSKIDSGGELSCTEIGSGYTRTSGGSGVGISSVDLIVIMNSTITLNGNIYSPGIGSRYSSTFGGVLVALHQLIRLCIKLPAPKNLTLERFGRNSKSERQSNMTKIETPHNIV
jgi:hypothetical protein